MSYDDWKTDPEYGMSHRDLHEKELKSELEYAEECIARLRQILEAIDREGRTANADGDVIIPSHVWDMVSRELTATGA